MSYDELYESISAMSSEEIHHFLTEVSKKQRSMLDEMEMRTREYTEKVSEYLNQIS